ncbi:hypothetical protein [Parafrigoribacterium humi]|jgi:hypothetical protein|uniref:hypothetical protein n=1 Tax=Parafrigoribacterium humi TaxID=3144664 RepID=UPI0032EC0583
MDQELPRPSRSDIRLDEADAGQWKVVDRRFRETNPRALLGFIKQVDGIFAATDLRHAGDPVRYDSLDAAIAEFLPASARTPSLMDAEQSHF